MFGIEFPKELAKLVKVGCFVVFFTHVMNIDDAFDYVFELRHYLKFKLLIYILP